LGSIIAQNAKYKNVKLQVASSPSVNTDGILITVSLLMNMVMVFRLVYGGANNSRCLDNTDQNGRRMVRLVCFDDAIKTRDVGTTKEVLELLFLHKLTGLIRSYQYSTDRR
jgi:hypothetical protein